MKVDPRAISAYQNTVNLSERAGRVKGSGGQAKGGVSQTQRAEDARVTISPEARQLAAGAAVQAPSITEASGVDGAKVAALREKVANGSLALDSHAIAQRLVDRLG